MPGGRRGACGRSCWRDIWRRAARGASLRRRAAELLNHAAKMPAEMDAADIESVPTTADPAELEDFDPHDATHLFWDQIRQSGFALREIERTDVADGEIKEVFKASKPLLNLLARIRRRKARAQMPVKILQI